MNVEICHQNPFFKTKKVSFCLQFFLFFGDYINLNFLMILKSFYLFTCSSFRVKF